MTNTNAQARIQTVLTRRIEREQARLAELVTAINQALGEGDISENSALEGMRSEADSVRVEIERLTAQRDTLDDGLAGRLTENVGAVFTLYHQEGGQTLKRQLLLSEEQEMRLDVITDASPVGQHLRHARVGTEFSVEVVRGNRRLRNTFKVLKIEVLGASGRHVA